MNAILYLQCVTTREEREIPVDWPAEQYVWLEGNFSCDCNRELFWLRAQSADEPEDTACGVERFRISRVVLDDGTELKDIES